MLLLSTINERIVVNVRPQHTHTNTHTSCKDTLSSVSSMSASSLRYARNTHKNASRLLLSIIIEPVVVNVRPQHTHTHKHTSCLLLSTINERIVVNVRPQHTHTNTHTSCKDTLSSVSSMRASSLRYARNTCARIRTHHAVAQHHH
jgi:hypothetical protein